VFRDQGLSFCVEDLSFRVEGFEVFHVVPGVWLSRSGFRVSVFGFEFQGLGFREQGFGFRVSGFGCRVWLHP
jgi:hypothetical protein